MIITISGKSCTGKTTVAKGLADDLQVPFFSVGNYYRENKQSTSDAGVDKALDGKVEEFMKKENNMVLEGRMAGYILEKMRRTGYAQGISVYLTLGFHGQIERFMKRSGADDLQYAVLSTIERDKADRNRLLNAYGVDVFNHGLYDLVIDSSDKSPERIKNIIKQSIYNKGETNDRHEKTTNRYQGASL